MRFFLLYQYLDGRAVRHLDDVKTTLWSADSATVNSVACYFLEFALVLRYAFNASWVVRQVELSSILNLTVFADNHCDDCELCVACFLDSFFQNSLGWQRKCVSVGYNFTFL